MARPQQLPQLLQFLLPTALILGLANWGVYLIRPASLWVTIPIAGIVLGIAARQAWSGRHHSPSLHFMHIGGHMEADVASGMTDRSLVGLPMSGCDITKPFG